ncbi:unnamed protein product [Phytomonas sp. EM1]|nr:unnamed protein product [Phytomonas sp. EM1]|eukprot:CCW65208.1 unnamed protein product [Phytomonas sp. isolate EM1]
MSDTTTDAVPGVCPRGSSDIVKPDANPTVTAPAHSNFSHGGREGETLLKNVVDLLSVMYGNKSIVGEDKQEPHGVHAVSAPGSAGHRLSTRASLYKRTLRTLQLSHTATETTVPIGGPLADEVAKAKSVGENDYIGQLLDYLVRTYSTQRTSDDSAVARDERWTNYILNSGEKSALAQFGSLRNTQRNNIDMSNFVNHTLDTFLRPGTQLNSTCSMLSNLEMDTNFANLLSFHTKSNLQNNMDELEEMTETLKPMFVGQQAMFKSIGSTPKDESNDSSLSTLCTMRMPKPYLTISQKGCASGTGSVPPSSQSMTLDSKALDLCHGRDTFDDLPAGGGARSSFLPEPIAAPCAARADGGEHTLPNRVEECPLLSELVRQEVLSRNILLALEQQLRGYIVSAYNTKIEAFRRLRR